MKYSRGILLLIAFTFLVGGLLALPAISHAVPPVVKTVPWVAANPLIPHDTWSGKEITLKGTSDVQSAGIQYTWDFGDGSPVVTGTVTNKYEIEAKHTYTGDPEDIFTATLTVQDTVSGDTGSEFYYVQIQDQTLEVEVNVAIDEGLWYLHKTRIDTICGTYACTYWPNTNYSGGLVNRAAVVASSVNAFEANGHLEIGNASNPYVETVQRGLRYLFTTLIPESISNRTYPPPTGEVNPDSNGNGIGIRANGSSTYPYANGAIMDAIITSGTPDTIAVTGVTNILGRKYVDIVQDMVDSYAFGQYNANSPARGGWRYSWNTFPDNSAAQWGAIGMIPAERNWGEVVLGPGGIIVPDWVKTENLIWLAYSQYYTGYEASSVYGAFGYTGKGTGGATSSSGMVQLAFDEVLTSDGRWQAGEKYLRDQWNSLFASNIDYYAMFAFTKAMRQANPAPVVNFGSSSSLGALDWYGAELSQGDPAQGFARLLVNAQVYNGSWMGGNRYYISTPLSTPWSILILGKTLFEPGSPVAVAQAIPNPGVVGQTITLDGSASFHQDPSKSIDSWEWDLDNDGDCDDASGPVVSYSWLALGNYTVTLCVSDDGTPEKEDTTTVTVRITTPPIAPTADANGPYVFCPQAQPWFLDGSGSVNPDEGVSEPGQPGDTIQEYAWELDGDGQFDDAFGPQPDVTAFFAALGPGAYLIQLRVTDTTATSFPSSGMGDLSDTASAQVSVKDAADPACSCIDDLAARPKSGKVQLTWTHTGAASYNVYRGTTSGGPFILVANTTSTYSTYLDTDVVNGTTYYYVLREVAINTDELCQSNEASATPTARVRRR